MTEHVHDYQYHIVHQGKKAFYWYAECECGDRLEKEEIESRLNEYGPLKEAFTIAIHLLDHADFKNGNTDPSGTTDEGEVYACRLMDKIKVLVPQLYSDILEGE